jgi:hypothetical protein
MPDTFSLSMILVLIVALLIAALWTRDVGEPGAAASMTARGFADAAVAAARCNLDGNPLRGYAWQAQRDRGPFKDLEAALSASYAATFEQAIRTIRVGPPVDWRPTDEAAAGAPPHPYVL